METMIISFTEIKNIKKVEQAKEDLLACGATIKDEWVDYSNECATFTIEIDDRKAFDSRFFETCDSSDFAEIA